MKIIKLITLCFMLVLIFLYTLFSSDVSQQVRNGIIICTNNIIPSLFPITFLSILLINSNLINELPKKIRFYFLFIISMLSGYPVGTKLLSEAVNNGNIERTQAEKIFPAFVSAGPGFTIGVAGLSVFSSQKVGILLFCSQTLSTALLFILLKGHKVAVNTCAPNREEGGSILNSLKKSITSISNICGYVIIFCTFNGIIKNIATEKIATVISYASEVTTAVLGSRNIYITSALISWCGLCVHAQIISAAKNFKGKYINLLKYRIIHMLFSIISTKLLCKVCGISFSAFSNITGVELIAENNKLYVIILMIFVIISLILSINRKSTGFIAKDLL